MSDAYSDDYDHSVEKIIDERNAALARLRKREAQCAEMRAALEGVSETVGRHCWCPGRGSQATGPHRDWCLRAQKALSSDAGRGWVSPDEYGQLRNCLRGLLACIDAIPVPTKTDARTGIVYKSQDVIPFALYEEAKRLAGER